MDRADLLRLGDLLATRNAGVDERPVSNRSGEIDLSLKHEALKDIVEKKL